MVVPGLGCASWMYVRLAEQLSRSHTVYLYDPPGHGWSEGTWNQPTTIEHLADHLAAWLRHMGLEGAPLLGHSLGAEVVFDLVIRSPGLAGGIIACTPTGVPENPSVPEQFLRLLADLPRERLALLLRGFPAYATAGFRRMFLLAESQRHHLTGPLLGQVQVPVLLIVAGRDPVVHAWTVHEIQRQVPHSVVRVIPGAPHAVTDACPGAVAQLTCEFISSLGGKRNF